MNIVVITVEPPPGIDPRDVGYVLCKHPDRVFERRHGRHVATVRFDQIGSQMQVVIGVGNDGPVSELRDVLSDAVVSLLPRVFGTAMRQDDHCVQAALKWGVRVHLPVVPAATAKRLERYLDRVESCPLPSVVSTYPNTGLVSVEVSWIGVTVRDALCQLWVAYQAAEKRRIPPMGEADVGRLESRGGDWLATHPFRDQIVSSLTRKRADPPSDEDESNDWGTDVVRSSGLPRGSSLAMSRARWVAYELMWANARTVLEIGCSTGGATRRVRAYLDAMGHHIDRWLAVDVDPRSVARAAHRNSDLEGTEFRVGTGFNPPACPDGSWDAVVLTEVVEHVPLDEFDDLMAGVAQARAGVVLVTTPNVEYNVSWTMKTEFRHKDHKWEATREEWRAMCGRLPHWRGRRHDGVGTYHAEYGHPTHATVLTDPVARIVESPPPTPKIVVPIERGSKTIPFVPETTPRAPSSDTRSEDVGAAVRYYADRGYDRVVVEAKHMGSRCVVAVPVLGTGPSTVWYRSGRRIPPHVLGSVWEDEAVPELRAWLEGLGYDPRTTAAVVDGEILPWSLTAGSLGRRYARFAAAVSVQYRSGESDALARDVSDLVLHTDHHLRPGPLRYAPFAVRLVARYVTTGIVDIVTPVVFRRTEVPTSRAHHLEHPPRDGGRLVPTPYVEVGTDDIGIASASEFFDDITGREKMYEGVVVKPATWRPEVRAAPAVKVRSESYLCMIRGVGWSRRPREWDEHKERASIAMAEAAASALDAWARGDAAAHRAALAAGLQYVR